MGAPKVLVKRPRARLEEAADRGSEDAEGVTNVFIPKLYMSGFRSRVQYLERLYIVKAELGETIGALGSTFLVRVKGKANGVDATIAAIGQWASGCTML